MNILVIPVQTVSDIITNSSSEVFILDTGKTCEEVDTMLHTFTSGFSYPEVFSLKDFREWRKKVRSGEIEEDWSYPGSIFSIAEGWYTIYKQTIPDCYRFYWRAYYASRLL